MKKNHPKAKKNQPEKQDMSKAYLITFFGFFLFANYSPQLHSKFNNF